MDKIQYKKLDEQTLEITKPVPQPEPIVNKYERSFIENQIIAITKQRDEMIALKEAELKECQDILQKMDELEIVVKPIEEVKEEFIVDGEPIKPLDDTDTSINNTEVL
jgi:hypothetical protein